ncbi:MAG: Chemotaxis protein methyltransferase CheR (EC [uncultured Aureispira sp.]|uniref:Chemotaxis protein methyltransferase CheR (EC) n=1 Tax=uncultured Aureispira sp. TaxID=1331704 RepID=A0A6S6SIB4_9BACT|nr:MAG: Chemotaxis protein methyltransferase CheR (EC [uncultured Aureispira sp.]
MLQKPGRLQITDEELNAFTTAVKTRFGLDFTRYEQKSLKRGLVRLISKKDLESMLGLWAQMLRDKSLIISYIDELLVNLTEFFRNYDLWQKIKEDVLKQVGYQNELTIWHAGCSTGEEIYTMGIVLKERFLLHKSRILATDLSTKALAQAKAGRYNNIIWDKCAKSYALYNPEGNVDRYFSKQEQSFEVIKQLKKHVRFERHNLVQDEMGERFKIIFCRNVMLYFDRVLKMKVLKLFYDALADDGFFIIGYYDMLPYKSKEMFTLHCSKTRIYRKNLNYK